MTTFNDYCNFVKSDLRNYKTPGTKKANLTREINALTDFLSNQERAYAGRKKGSAFGWYLGDRVFKVDINTTRREIEFLMNLRNNL